MEIIQNIFGLVLKFGMQLSSGVWRVAAADDDVSAARRGDVSARTTLRHSQYEQICKTHGAFKEHAAFLFKGLKRFGVFL